MALVSFSPAVNWRGRGTPGSSALSEGRDAKTFSEGWKETLFCSSLPTPRRWWFESPSPHCFPCPVLWPQLKMMALINRFPHQKHKNKSKSTIETIESKFLRMGPGCLFLKSSLGDSRVFCKLRTTRWNEAHCPEINIRLTSWWSAMGRAAQGCGRTAWPYLPSNIRGRPSSQQTRESSTLELPLRGCNRFHKTSPLYSLYFLPGCGELLFLQYILSPDSLVNGSGQVMATGD